jgi:hypothetical protein
MRIQKNIQKYLKLIPKVSKIMNKYPKVSKTYPKSKKSKNDTYPKIKSIEKQMI